MTPIILEPDGPDYPDRTFASVVLEALSDDFDSATYSARAGRWVNDCLRLMARSSHIPLSDMVEALDIEAGTASYSLPDRFVRVVDVWDTSTSTQLVEVTQVDLDGYVAASGTPQMYAVYGDTIVFYPTPTDARPLSLRYVAVTIGLADTDLISGVIPDEYGDVIVAYVRWHLFRLEDDLEMAAYWEAQFELEFARLKSDLHKRGVSTRRVPGMWGRGSSRPRFVRPA